ncbi:MAG: hypothetical protein AB1726_05835 [Planctomycetota bacterium]
MGPSPRPRRRLLPLKAALSLALTAVLAEALLHVAPSLIPSSYRRLYPLHGAGFYAPDLLDRTPIREVPLPLYVGDYVGLPPADLAGIGLVAPEENPDPLEYPEVEVRVDELGFPNPSRSVPDRADVILVGDSFLVGAGAKRPAGLQALLAAALGQSVYNLGVAALGPYQELWLLATQGLPKRPSLVIWFFFGGNDTLDAATTLLHEKRGEDTYGKVHAGRRPPVLRLPAIVRYLVGTEREEARIEPLPGLVLRSPDGGARRLWMHPNYLLLLSKTTEQWEADRSWAATKDVLRDARARTEAAGARFVLVYLPSKAQVVLPYVDRDPDLVHRMANFRRPVVPTGPPEEFLAAALAHRGDLEDLMQAFCAAEGIAYVSATPGLEALARRGDLGYLAADTHWAPRGQEALLPALLAVLRE